MILMSEYSPESDTNAALSVPPQCLLCGFVAPTRLLLWSHSISHLPRDGTVAPPLPTPVLTRIRMCSSIRIYGYLLSSEPRCHEANNFNRLTKILSRILFRRDWCDGCAGEGFSSSFIERTTVAPCANLALCSASVHARCKHLHSQYGCTYNRNVNRCPSFILIKQTGLSYRKYRQCQYAFFYSGK